MKNKHFIFNFLLIMVFTILALYLTMYGRVDEVLSLLSTIKMDAFIKILLYGVGYHVFVGWIYYLITKTHKKNYTFLQSLQLALVGSFFSGITPSASGGQIGQAYVLKKQGVAYSDGASILWIDFIIYQSVMVV